MFREVLHGALTNTEGCFGVLITGTDGIVVENVRQNICRTKISTLPPSPNTRRF